MFGALILTLLAVAVLYPETSLGRGLRRWTERTALRLTKVNAAKVLVWGVAAGVLIAAILAVVWLKDGVVLAQGLGDLLGPLLVGDTAFYFEAMAAAWLLRTVLHWTAVVAQAKRRGMHVCEWVVKRIRRAPRQVRRRRVGRKAKPPVDEGEPGWAFA